MDKIVFLLYIIASANVLAIIIFGAMIGDIADKIKDIKKIYNILTYKL